MRYCYLALIQLVAASNVMPGMRPRQGDSAECTSSAHALVTGGVEPSGDLDAALLAFQSTASPEDFCDPATALPESLQSTYSAYKSGVLSYYSAHASEIAQVESSCAGNEYVTSLTWLSSVFDGSFCTATINATATIGTGVTAATTTASSSMTAVTAGAASVTGVVGNAAILAGVIGAVAAL